MLKKFNNVYEVFQCLKQTSILNAQNLHGKIFFGFRFHFEIWEFGIFNYFFGHMLGLGFPWKVCCYDVWWVYVWIEQSFKKNLSWHWYLWFIFAHGPWKKM
jgi:hypothetical protein